MTEKMQIKNEGGNTDEPPGSNITNNDNSGISRDYIPTVRAENTPLWILDWLHYPTSMGCDGRILSPMAVFLPQSNIFLALG